MVVKKSEHLGHPTRQGPSPAEVLAGVEKNLECVVGEESDEYQWS